MLSPSFINSLRKRLSVAIEENEDGEIALDVNELEILLDEIEEQRDEIRVLNEDLTGLINSDIEDDLLN